MANGNFAGGDGSVENPYLIEDAFDLDAVRNDLTAHYKLIKDIDLDIAPFNEGEGWIPIGDFGSDTSLEFKGVFNGDGHVINNLFINRPKIKCQGFFGRGNGATISNIGIEGVNITGLSDTGGLVGYALQCNLSDSYVTGEISGRSRTGGFAGNIISRTTIKNSYATVKVNGESKVGGFIGYVNGNINNCFATGDVKGTSERIGGFIGDIGDGKISNCYATGDVEGNVYVGGFGGYLDYGKIFNSYSTGKVQGQQPLGGFIGGHFEASRGTADNCFWDTTTSEQRSSYRGTGLTTEEMQNPQTFIDARWHSETLEDGVSIWILEEGEYPKLWFEFKSYHLFKQGNNIFYFDGVDFLDTGLTEPLSSQDFKDFGLKNTLDIPKNKFLELNSFTMLTWTNETQTPTIALTVPEYKPINFFQEPEIVTWTDSDQPLSLSITGKKDVIKDLVDPKILVYNTTEEKPETIVKGIPKDNYYKYNVTIDDSTTLTTPDRVLISETDWLTEDVSETAIIPAGFVNKLNPYDVYVSVTQFDDQEVKECGQVLLYNEAPIFMLGAVSNNTLSAVIDDPDKDKIKYKIVLNGKQIYPEKEEWSEYFATPFSVFHQFKNKDIKVGEDNSCLLIAEDEFGTQANYNVSFTGDYAGLVFADSNYDYYSVDPETIFKRLNFGMIVAGYDSEIAHVRLINKNYYPVKNIRLILDKNDIQPRTDVKISKYSGESFIGTDSLTFLETLQPNEEISFYVKVTTDMLAYGLSMFSIRVSADGIIE